MGNLTETATWSAGVPYFEADAILTGGPNCPDNIPIQALANRTAFLKKQIDDAVSGALTVMYANRLKTARTISMSGDGTWSVSFDGNGNVTSAMTLASTGVAAGSYAKVTVDGKGRVTAGSTLAAADIPPLDWSKITSGKPTTLAGYGITDAQPLDSDLTALAALVTTGFYVNTGVGTVAARALTAGTGISISNGDGVAGNPVITNTGVTSLTGTANQVTVSASTGGVTLSLPQAIHSGAKPSFAQVALAADPVNALDAATKQYVDNVAAGLDVKMSVRAASTAPLTLSGALTVDGVALAAGDRVLVKNQATASQNGLYTVGAGAWTRTTDADVWGELVSAFVFVEQGSTNGDTGWVCTADPGGTLGTTPITWTQFAGAGTVTAGTGLSVSGNQVALANSGVAAGTYPKVTVDVYGRVTGGAGLEAADIPALDWSKITSGKPTTLAGYGITNFKDLALTGVPTAPTAATGTSTTQLATTAFVQQELAADLATAAPLMDGVAAVGTSTKSARENHVHPTDTTRAPLASPAFTGTPTVPTAAAGTNTTQIASTAFVQSACAVASPAGSIGIFAMSTAPSGWLKANGAAVSRTTYAALFAAIGTTYGAGDGTTTFNLPDLRGEFVRGWDDGRGVDAGRAIGSAQADDLISHSHTAMVQLAGTSHTVSNVGDAPYYTKPGATSATGGSETRPRNVAQLYCIKF